MAWRNAYRIAQIAITLYPNLAGARFGKWHEILKKFRRTDLALWRKYCVQKPTLEEISLAAALAEQLTEADRNSYQQKRCEFLTNRMTEFAYRLFPFKGRE